MNKTLFSGKGISGLCATCDRRQKNQQGKSMSKIFFVFGLTLSLSAKALMPPDMPMRGMLFPESGRDNTNMLQVHYDQSFPRVGTSGLDEFGVRVHSAVIKAEQDTYSVNAGFSELQVNDKLPIPPWSGHRGFLVPRTLESISVGGAWNRHLKNDDDFGLSLGIGSESDQPFYGIRETSIHLTALYHLPLSTRSNWTFFLNYSNNRTFANGVPLPGAMYSYVDPEKRIMLMAGFPLIFISYGITDRWDVRGSYFIPKSISLETGYKIVPPALRAYGRFEIQQKSFLRETREDLTEQLFFERDKLSLGLQLPLRADLVADISTGYEYDRSFYESERMQGLSDAVTLPDDWFAKAQLTYRF
jgi:hypothetical protein